MMNVLITKILMPVLGALGFTIVVFVPICLLGILWYYHVVSVNGLNASIHGGEYKIGLALYIALMVIQGVFLFIGNAVSAIIRGMTFTTLSILLNISLGFLLVFSGSLVISVLSLVFVPFVICNARVKFEKSPIEHHLRIKLRTSKTDAE